MNIFIEGSPLITQRSGVGQYTKRLSEAMARLAPEDNFFIFGFKFFTRQLPRTIFDKDMPIKYRFVRFLPGRGYNLLFRFHLAPPIDFLLAARPDVIWFPNFICWPVFSPKTKRLITIYDLSFIHYGQFSSPANREHMTKYVPRSIKAADKILTISKSSRREIAELYKIEEKAIEVIYPAVDPAIFRPHSRTEIEKVAKRYKLPAKYVLFTGTLEPRKNVEGLLRAYARIPSDIRQQYPLVLVGGKGWLDEPIWQLISELQASGESIITAGYVPDEDLPAVYCGASLFVYPSFYEGFGMPPLEAMACGVPVITSDNSSLPEVVGDAGLMVPADNSTLLTQEMARVLSDQALAGRLRKAGYAQAKKFSWEASAKKMLGVIRELQ